MTELERRLEMVEKRCCLDVFGRYALKILLLCEWDPDFEGEGIYLDELMEAWRNRETDAPLVLSAGERKWMEEELHFLAECVSEDASGRRCFQVRRSFLEFLETGWMAEPEEGCLEIYPNLEAAEEPDVERSLYRSMITLTERKREKDKGLLFMNLAGLEGSGRLENVKAFCREKQMGLVLLDGRGLLELTRKERKELYRVLELDCLLKERVMAVRWDNAREESELFELIREMERGWAHLPLVVMLLTGRALRASISGVRHIPAVFMIREQEAFSRKEMGKRYAEKWKISFQDGFGEMWQRFRFTPGQFKKILEQAEDMALARGERYPSRDELKEVCCRQAEHRFAGKASRINTQFSWDDLVLPEASKELLRDLCSRNKNREQVYGSWNFASRFPYGLGTSILFTGSPGTGKTMAAQVMAKELDLELFRVNLSAVVSKYVGETEKNLNQIFDEASKSLCILFFDEADVLFGKRTEVKDSQDKYQNMEAAFLLQKMEEYDGVSILATNYQQNIDEAFKRRIQYVVEFPLPGAQERLGMWRRAFPKECPVQETVDLQFLAEQFELTGSNIKNIAVNAAFLAASDEEAVGMQQILRALRNEYRKSGKRLTASELGQYGGSVQG